MEQYSSSPSVAVVVVVGVVVFVLVFVLVLVAAAVLVVVVVVVVCNRRAGERFQKVGIIHYILVWLEMIAEPVILFATVPADAQFRGDCYSKVSLRDR